MRRSKTSTGLCMVVICMTLLLKGCANLPAGEVQRIQRANKLYAASNYVDAKRLLNVVIDAYPRTKGVGEAYYIRGMCELQGDRLDHARSDFQTALTMSSRSDLIAMANAQLGHLAYRNNRFTTASTHYAAAVKDFPKRPPLDEVYYRWGDSLQKTGHWKESRGALAKVMHLFPKSKLEIYARRKFAWRHEYFSIQCGAFEKSTSAQSLANTLRRQRFSAAVEVSVSGPRALHKVYVGSYPKYADAQIELARVRQVIPDAIIAP